MLQYGGALAGHRRAAFASREQLLAPPRVFFGVKPLMLRESPLFVLLRFFTARGFSDASCSLVESKFSESISAALGSLEPKGGKITDYHRGRGGGGGGDEEDDYQLPARWGSSSRRLGLSATPAHGCKASVERPSVNRGREVSVSECCVWSSRLIFVCSHSKTRPTEYARRVQENGALCVMCCVLGGLCFCRVRGRPKNRCCCVFVGDSIVKSPLEL